MISCVWNKNYLQNLDILFQAFVLRGYIFIDYYKWEELDSFSNMEIDQYDHSGAIYIILHDENRVVYGCLRILPTKLDYMVEHTFAHAKPSHLPKSNKVFECSRFCTSQRARKTPKHPLISNASNELYYGLQKFGMDNSYENLITFTFVKLEKLFRQKKWPYERISNEIIVAQERSVITMMEISKANQDFAYAQAYPNLHLTNKTPLQEKPLATPEQENILIQVMTNTFDRDKTPKDIRPKKKAA